VIDYRRGGGRGDRESKRGSNGYEECAHSMDSNMSNDDDI